MAHFEIQPYDKRDESIEIRGPGDLTLFVDYDDVNHEEVGQAIEDMVAVLNIYWQYARFARSRPADAGDT